jgi:deoxyribonuclease IV
MPIVGAHVSAAVSLELAFERAEKIGAECFQFFISPPQRWLQTKHGVEEIERFKQTEIETGIGPNFIHGTYLVNLATQNPMHLQTSIEWLIYAMKMAQELKSAGVIFHTGSYGKLGFEATKEQIINSLTAVLNAVEAIPGEITPYLILENSAGQGGTIGSTLTELGELLKGVNHPKLKICLDTCHAFAAGYDVKNLIGLKDVITEFEEEIGLQNLVAIHANDSKFELGNKKDRHENIGEGFIGQEGFENLINHPSLAKIPFLLEVPGFTDTGPDKENVDLLKSLFKP